MKIRRTEIFLIIFSIIFLVVRSTYDLNYFDYQSPIPYSEWRSISWGQFKGLKPPFYTLDGNQNIAFISTNVVVSKLSSSEIEVTTYFHPSRSYVFNQRTYDKALLRHELYHLHITEYCSRLFRKDLNQNFYIDIDKTLRLLKRKYEKLENSLQHQYDSETYHGYILKKQKEWEEDIDKKIFELEEFKSSLTKLRFN